MCNNGRCSLEHSDGSDAVPSDANGDHSDALPSDAESGHSDGSAHGLFLLSVTTSGSGIVLSTTTGVDINCGQTCSALVPQGTSVQLVATPAAIGSFSSWTGCTSIDAETCTVVVEKTTNVTAMFKLKSGAACAQEGDCATGFCVSNVCCATACAGPCNSSCPTGTCIPQPTRTACGTKTGPGGPGAGTDIALICDGLGVCKAPSFVCPSTSETALCGLDSNICCNLSFSNPAGHNLTCTVPTSCAAADEGDNFHGYSCSSGKRLSSRGTVLLSTTATLRQLLGRLANRFMRSQQQRSNASLKRPPYPRPTNGIFVAMIVMNRTFAPGGRLAM